MSSLLVRVRLVAAIAVGFSVVGLARQDAGPAPASSVQLPRLSETDAREWLTYLSSDQLQGREAFTEGYGMAASYVAEHLREWGLKPLGDNGTYFQTIKYEASNPKVTKFTRNVVGMVEGRDPALKDSYVLFGAHLDHVGAASNGEPKGVVNEPLDRDAIWNGADDDGSGSVAIMEMAKAMAAGPKPKRSVVFIWHAGEEEGLIGSLYMASHPVVPLDKVQAEFNIDMIGRNRDDVPSQSDTVFVIGDDRISTDLHNLIVRANSAFDRPLTLDYEYNDPNDPNDFYTRSDHYSYASKGIPIAFFFTGTHRDYHANTDSVDKILFPKLIRIAQMIYEAGFAVADGDQPLRRDNLGARAGRGSSGALPVSCATGCNP